MFFRILSIMWFFFFGSVYVLLLVLMGVRFGFGWLGRDFWGVVERLNNILLILLGLFVF